MKYEVEGAEERRRILVEIVNLLLVLCRKLLHRQNCAEAEEVGPNSEGSKNAIQTLFRLEGPKPTKTAFGSPLIDKLLRPILKLHCLQEFIRRRWYLPARLAPPGPAVASESEATPRAPISLLP